MQLLNIQPTREFLLNLAALHRSGQLDCIALHRIAAGSQPVSLACFHAAAIDFLSCVSTGQHFREAYQNCCKL